MRLAIEVGNIEIVLCAITALIFVVAYATLARWWETDIGRNVMALVAAIALVTGLYALRILFGASLDTMWYVWLRLAVLGTVPIILVQRIFIFIRTTHRAKSKKKGVSS